MRRTINNFFRRYPWAPLPMTLVLLLVVGWIEVGT